MKTLLHLLAAGVAAAVLVMCASEASAPRAAEPALDLSGMDSTADPADDFFQYANGTWYEETEIPPSKSGWGSFYVVYDQALANMRALLDSSAGLTDAPRGSITQQMADFYASGMDSAAIEAAGLTPLQPDLDRIAALSDAQGVLKEVAAEYARGDGTLFSFYVGPDDKNSNVERVHLDQGGLGLPNRDYYFEQDATTREIREAYHRYAAKILSLSGDDSTTAAAKATAVIALETKLAEASKSPVELRDPEANYHLLALDAFQQQTPGIDWQRWLAQVDVRTDTVQVGQPAFYDALDAQLKATPLAVWKDYLRLHLITGYAPFLSSPFADAHFDFYNRTLSGQQQPEVRWKRMVALVDQTLGDALGQLYVERYFPPEAKARMNELVDNLQETYRERIRRLRWMSATTRQKALDKLDAFVTKIGYPDRWEDYSSIDIDRTSFVQNLQNIGRWHHDDMVDKLGKPVDKTEWGMTAPTVNAGYSPSFNDITFPAGILQPPFFYQDADDAVNYGAIGAVIGHEMTHGFDDQGSQYDKDGNLMNWWTEEDRRRFEAQADQVVRQYDAYTVLDTVHVNGRLTLGENIADIGGLAIAYAAFKKTPQGQGTETIDGLTPDQRFFLSFAQVWRIKNTPQLMQWRINNDPHAPERYRVVGPLSNMESFYEAFDVVPGDAMYRPGSVRVAIW